MEAAIDWLRTKGLAAAAKKAGRTAAEGLVGVAVSGTRGAVVEVNSETDFVAKNEQFQEFVRAVSQLALSANANVEGLLAATYPGGGTVEEKLTSNIATIGEHQSLRRSAVLQVGDGVVVPYVHNAAAAGLGKIGVLIALESTGDKAQLEALGKQLAMHIAAANPLAMTGEEIDPAIVAREAAIAREKQADKIVGKPPEVVEKIIRGPVDKFIRENALMSQLFVMDNKTKIEDVVKAAAKTAGAPVELKAYVRFQLGEGIEKQASDFAAEVAAVSGIKQ
jgi:elongation factor Ts